MIKIRKMTIGDLDQVHKMGSTEERFKVSDSQKEFWTKDQLKNWIEKDDDVLLVAEENKEIIGFTLSQLHKPTGKATWENLQVKKDYQKQGIGTKLSIETIRELKKKCTAICGFVEPDNSPMRNLMKNLGFEEGKRFIWMNNST